jgi:DNA-nicking Smr family endonuclease
MGVIKFQIAGWLAGHPRVLAFHTALPQDGGTGAIYVYLRRHPRSAP